MAKFLITFALLGFCASPPVFAESEGITIEVKAKKRTLPNSSKSSVKLDQDEIASLPQGDNVSLSKLLTSTTAGAIEGPFGQTFVRGNHGNVQYQIDGVQIPDSPSSTFAQIFSPRYIDRLEIITGGIPAEYGQRLSAVVNITSKGGSENVLGNLDVNYGSYDTLQPTLTLGGSAGEGSFRYYLSGSYKQTGRGIDTPQPKSVDDIDQGGKDSVHNRRVGHDQFAKLDWQLNNKNRFTFLAFNSSTASQIPNYPYWFRPTDSIFTTPNKYGSDPLVYTPSNTDNRQFEENTFGQLVWRYTLSDEEFLQIAPYYKYSYLSYNNDPANDLISGNPAAVSFRQNRGVNNTGLKADYTRRIGGDHLVKAGAQLQTSWSSGNISVQQQLANPPVVADVSDRGSFQSVYVQDDYNFAKDWMLNVGLRWDATEFRFGDDTSADQALQPRLGVNHKLTDSLKVHAFYGRLFQPAPLEDLRRTYQLTGSVGSLPAYDVKAETDDYFEVGIAHQPVETQTLDFTVYYKLAKNMLDEVQLFNTSISQPYNFEQGFAYGAEVGWKGEWNSRWSHYMNYAYGIAKGKGISGGFFATGAPEDDDYHYLDHVQYHTANAGVTYKHNAFSWSTQGLYGSGLRSGHDGDSSLPAHLTFDTTVGYELAAWSGESKTKLAFDVLNIFDNVYPITIANGFNGSHYAAGRQFFVRASQDF